MIPLGVLQQQGGETAVWVAPAPLGNDANAGTEEAPLATLAAAQTAVRGLLPGDAVTVILREGTYQQTASFALSALDSGEPDNPVTWKAYTGETARITGSQALDPAWFSVATSGDPAWARIPAAAQGNVMVCDLDAQGITDYGTIKPRGSGQSGGVAGLELFVDDVPSVLSKYPKNQRNVTNYLTSSNDATAWNVISGASITDFETVVFDGTAGQLIRSSTTAELGSVTDQVYAFSVEMKSDNISTIGLALNNTDAWNTYDTDVEITLTSGWVRYVLIATCTSEGNGGQRLMVGDIDRSGNTIGGVTGTLNIRNMQMEPLDLPSEIVATTSVPVTEIFPNSNGNTVDPVTHIVTAGTGGPIAYPDDSMEIATTPTTTSFTIAAGADADKMPAWESAPDAWIHGYIGYWWADQVIDLASINASTRTFTLARSPYLNNIGVGHNFYIFNLLEEIGMGEYYLDRVTGRLYYWPDGDIMSQDLQVSLLEDAVTTTSSASYIEFENIQFGMGRGDLISGSGGTDLVFTGCKFFGSGNRAITLLNGTGHAMLRSEFVDTGLKSIELNAGVRASLTSSDMLVENCEIHRPGRLAWAYQAAAKLIGCGHTFKNNYVHDTKHLAVQLQGNNHLIENNEFGYVVSYASDMGAIYAGKRWDWRGNVVRKNYFHDIQSPLPGSGVFGVYLDDCMTGVVAYQNYFVDISHHALLMGGGRDNLMDSNIIVRCGRGLSADSRGYAIITDPAGAGLDFLAMQYNEGVQYQQEPWLSAYPANAAIPNNWTTIAGPANSPYKYPEDGTFTKNLGWDNTLFKVEDFSGGDGCFSYFASVADNVEDSDPLFVDEAGGDLNMEAGSPYFGITGNPQSNWFSQIGIQAT